MSYLAVILCYGRLTPLTFNNIISNIVVPIFVVILCYGRLTPLTFNNIISNIVVPSFVVLVTEQVVSSTHRQGR